MDTAEFAKALARAGRPVRVVHPPLIRTGCWLLIALAVVVPLVAAHGLRSDLSDRLRDASFVVGAAASLLTGTLAALGCLTASLPDRSRCWLLLPLPSLSLWMITLGHGCLTEWVSYDAGSLALGSAARCFAAMLLVSLPLSASMFLMLRHVARLRPTLVVLAGGLAVAGMTSTAMSLLFRLDATVMSLAFNLGAPALIVAIEAAVARRFLARAVSVGRRHGM